MQATFLLSALQPPIFPATSRTSSSGSSTATARRWSTGYQSAGFPHVIAVDTEGNIYVAGTTSEGFSGRGTAKPPGDIEIVKFSPGGQWLWARTYGGSDNAYDEPGALAADSSGNVYVAAVSGGLTTELVLGKYDAAGN